MARSRRSKQDKREPMVSTPEKPTERDFALARLAEAHALAKTAADELADAISAIMDGEDPDEDIESALDSLGAASRATEAAEKMTSSIDHEEIAPWEDNDEGDGD